MNWLNKSNSNPLVTFNSRLARLPQIEKAAAQLAASKTLNETEVQVLLTEFRTPKLSWLDEDNYHDAILDILSEVKLVSGVLLYPDGSNDQAYQVEMVKRLLAGNPRFRHLHQGDIVQAFYMNASGMFPEKYRHYNRELNGEFVGDVLAAFITWKDRHLGSKSAAIRLALNPPAEAARIVITDDDFMDYINQDYQAYQAGNETLIFNTSPKYCLLRRRGLLRVYSREHWWEWYRETVARLYHKRVYQVAENTGDKAAKKSAMSMYEAILATGNIPLAEHQALIHSMRRFMYLEFLATAARDALTFIG